MAIGVSDRPFVYDLPYSQPAHAAPGRRRRFRAMRVEICDLVLPDELFRVRGALGLTEELTPHARVCTRPCDAGWVEPLGRAHEARRP